VFGCGLLATELSILFPFSPTKLAIFHKTAIKSYKKIHFRAKKLRFIRNPGVSGANLRRFRCAESFCSDGDFDGFVLRFLEKKR